VAAQPGPELLEAHPSTLTRPGAVVRHTRGTGAYARGMLPGTGSGSLDVVLEVVIVVAIIVSLVLLIRNYRGR
jgi:hypothetical protein